jgi:hypothetical protein
MKYPLIKNIRMFINKEDGFILANIVTIITKKNILYIFSEINKLVDTNFIMLKFSCNSLRMITKNIYE